jgi:hypothetical protein
MRRLLLYLPLCLCLIPETPPRPNSSAADGERAPLATVTDDGSPLPDAAGMERLARTDPIAFLENCLRRYDRDVKGYTLTMQKQERIEGKLQRSEIIAVQFRGDPFSVLFDWKEGARLAQKVLYVKGENNDKLLVLPKGKLAAFVAGIVERDADGEDAKKSGRYPLTEFGLKIATQRTLGAWQAAKKNGTLNVEYLGEKKIKEAGDRVCYVLKRGGYRKPEEDGIAEFTAYIDKETWLQVGSVSKGMEGQLIGEYFFRDIKLNPEFKPDFFTREALKR